MKIYVKDLGRERRDIKIVLFSDLHIGSNKCRLDLIKEQIETVRKDKNCYAIILGDLINNATKGSVSDIYSEGLPPMEQMKLAVSLFEPIKDKIIAVTSGNHERRTYRDDGIDLMQFFSLQLGLDDIYDYCACCVGVKFGRITCSEGGSHNIKGANPATYFIYLSHGDGSSGRLIGSKANNLERRGEIVNADVIVAGHTHQPMVFSTARYEIIRTHCAIKRKETLFVNAGSFLEYESYAEERGMRPSSMRMPIIYLGGTDKYVATATL